MRSSLTLSAAAVAIVLTSADALVIAQAPTPQPALKQAQDAAMADTGVGQYYTEAQALRGQGLYNRHCAYCHQIDPAKPLAMSGLGGGPLAPRWIRRISAGIARYPSVYYAFRRLDYMPANDTQSVTPQQKADILAYLLQQNGLLPGGAQLQPDYGLMQAMPLPAEPGFVHMFNGRDLSGWQALLGHHCTAPPEGCGITNPGDVFFAKDGVLATTGRIHGMLLTSKRYKNFTLRLEQRVPTSWDDIDDLIPDQGGILIFIGNKGGTIRTWPEAIELEGAYHDLMAAQTLSRLIKVKATVDREARDRARKKVNEWQRIEVVSIGGVVKVSLNGVLVSTLEFVEDPDPGYIALQSQGGPVEYRNIRIRED